MAVALRQSRRFDATSPVTRYWLANCVGFSLAGGGRGTVERVLADGNPHDPSLLEVRTSYRRGGRRAPPPAIPPPPPGQPPRLGRPPPPTAAPGGSLGP